MVPKPQSAPSKPVETPAAQPQAASSEPKEEEKMEEDKKEEPEKTEKKETAEKSDDKPASAGGLSTSDLVVGEDYNRMVQNIMDMGYGRDEVSFDEFIIWVKNQVICQILAIVDIVNIQFIFILKISGCRRIDR